MWEDVQDVTRLDDEFISVHGYMIRATPEQEERVLRLTPKQRMDLLLRLAVLPHPGHNPINCHKPGCNDG